MEAAEDEMTNSMDKEEDGTEEDEEAEDAIREDKHLARMRTTPYEQEDRQRLIYTKYGYIREMGILRSIFTMWPSAAKTGNARE